MVNECPVGSSYNERGRIQVKVDAIVFAVVKQYLKHNIPFSGVLQISVILNVRCQM